MVNAIDENISANVNASKETGAAVSVVRARANNYGCHGS